LSRIAAACATTATTGTAVAVTAATSTALIAAAPAVERRIARSSPYRLGDPLRL
jgi:hypothetical protein